MGLGDVYMRQKEEFILIGGFMRRLVTQSLNAHWPNTNISLPNTILFGMEEVTPVVKALY